MFKSPGANTLGGYGLPVPLASAVLAADPQWGQQAPHSPSGTLSSSMSTIGKGDQT